MNCNCSNCPARIFYIADFDPAGHGMREIDHRLAAITGHRSAEPFDRAQDRLAPKPDPCLI